MSPPGCARLATNPPATGSGMIAATMGMVLVACWAARRTSGPPTVHEDISGSPTSSAARVGRRSTCPLPTDTRWRWSGHPPRAERATRRGRPPAAGTLRSHKSPGPRAAACALTVGVGRAEGAEETENETNDNRNRTALHGGLLTVEVRCLG